MPVKRAIGPSIMLLVVLLGAAIVASAPTSQRPQPGKMTAHGALLAEAFNAACETPADLDAARVRNEAAESLFRRHAAPACKRLASHLLPNLIVDAGESYLVNAWIGTQTLPNMKFHALGTSNAASAETQTACQAELTTQYASDNVRATGTLLVGSTASVLQSVGQNQLDASPSTTVREWCLMSSASVGSGVMWSRIVLPDTVVPLNGIMVTTYNLTIE